MTSISLTGLAAMHLTAVYLAMMGPLVCLWLQWRAKQDRLAADLDRYLLWLAVAALLIAALLGGLALLCIGQLFPDAYLAAARVLPKSRYWPYGAVELVFSLVCFVLAGALAGGTVASRWRFATRWLATLLGSTNLVYHFPPLFVMLGVLCTRPSSWGHSMKFTALLSDPEIVARVVHHLLAALVIAGMAMACYGVRRGGDAARAITWGGRIAAIAVIGQIFAGLWLLMAMPGVSRQALSGGDTIAAGLFAGSLLITFFALPRLTSAAFGNGEPRPTAQTIVLVLAIVVLMTATRHRTRTLLLASHTAHQDTAAINSGKPSRYIDFHQQDASCNWSPLPSLIPRPGPPLRY